MELTDEQKKTVKSWVSQGCSLGEIQRKLSDEFKIAMPFIDVRFLIIDLGLQVKDAPSKKSDKVPDLKKAIPGPEDDIDPLSPSKGGAVTVSIDRVKKPGALFSGIVTFSDGTKGTWSIDQFGRVGLDTGRPGYKPSQEDVMAFQDEVQRQLQRHGL